MDNPNTGTLPSGGSTPAPTATGTVQSGPSGGSVNVQRTVRQRPASYVAELEVTNSSQAPLENATFSLAIEGRVMDVNGGSWSQDGDLLIVDLSGSLAAGDSTEVTYSATGKAGELGACGLVGGECSVA
jgi:cellulase/cellobiase CelA1